MPPFVVVKGEMIIPSTHLMKVIVGATFDFRFQYLLGPQPSITPVDLTPYQAEWVITSLDGSTIYSRYDSGGIIGTSGVFFGGDQQDPANGIIDLIITAPDTVGLPWTQAAYWLTVQPPTLQEVPLLKGHIAIVGTLP